MSNVKTNIYRDAAKKKLRFATSKGNLSVEQLMDLNMKELDELAVSLEEEHAKSGKKSFLVEKSNKDKESKLRFDIVFDILQSKIKSHETASKAAETKAHNEMIDSLILKKKNQEMAEMSLNELEALRK